MWRVTGITPVAILRDARANARAPQDEAGDRGLAAKHNLVLRSVVADHASKDAGADTP